MVMVGLLGLRIEHEIRLRMLMILILILRVVCRRILGGKGTERVFYGDACDGGGDDWILVKSVWNLNVERIDEYHLVCGDEHILHRHLDDDEMNVCVCDVFYLLRRPPLSFESKICPRAEVATPVASFPAHPLVRPCPPKLRDLTLLPIPGLDLLLWWLLRLLRESSESYSYFRRS